MNAAYLLDQIKYVCKNGKCNPMDMSRMMEAARELGKLQLAAVIEKSLQENNILNSEYARVLAPWYGVLS